MSRQDDLHKKSVDYLPCWVWRYRGNVCWANGGWLYYLWYRNIHGIWGQVAPDYENIILKQAALERGSKQ